MRWRDHRDFPGGPMVKTFNAGSVGSIPGQETKISHGTAENKQTNKQTTEDFTQQTSHTGIPSQLLRSADAFGKTN